MRLPLVFLSILPFLLDAQVDESDFFEINVDRDHPERVYTAFEDFKKKFNKKYSTPKENQLRMQNFVKTFNKVENLNKKSEEKGHTTQFAINKFSDLSAKEFKQRLSTYRPNITSQSNGNLKFNQRHKRDASEVPKNYDLRVEKVNGYDVIGAVKDQKGCACCWGFAIVAVVESVSVVHFRKKRVLSEQELCDCATNGSPGCRGGSLFFGASYVASQGLASASDYEYEDGRANYTGMCEAEVKKRMFPPGKLDYIVLHPNEQAMIPGIIYEYKIPVAVYFAIGDAFKSYQTGVLVEEDCNLRGTEWHAGAIVGYGESEDRFGRLQKYWIMKNSWGPVGWGDKGYIKVIRGRNWCGIENEAIVANIVGNIHHGYE